MEPTEKKLNDDVVVFMRKRSETDAPRYTARLKTYLDFHQKRRRAAAARKHSEHIQRDQASKKTESGQKEKPTDNCHQEDGACKRRGGACMQGQHRAGSLSRSRSQSHEPVDRCGCRRRRRRRRYSRPRRRSRRRRRRRRRRRSCRRRRRRSGSRRRRRRSCRRRRARRRRCR